jgi:hypothetical protein
VVVLEDLLDLRRLLASALADAVETLGVCAREVVELELRVGGELQLVARLPGRDRGLDLGVGFQVLVGQLEAVVPERHLARAQLLGLLPGRDAVLLAGSPPDRLEDEIARPRRKV